MLGLGKGNRFEHRIGSADANPYLIIAASLAAGIHGIENKLKIPNKDELLKQELPNTLEKALLYFENSDAAKEFFGEKFVKMFITLGKHEVELFNTAVTDWEWDRYLEMA